MRASAAKPDQLLCEACGYALEGLPAEGVCPECARPVALSRPERRVGSPWQRKPSLMNWLRTGWVVLRHPRSCWDEVRIEPGGSDGLLTANLLVAAALPAIPPVVDSLRSPAGRGEVAAFIIVMFLVPLGVLITLTLVEGSGLRFFGALRRWRVTRRVAVTVCAHASFGWVVGGTLEAVLITLMLLLGGVEDAIKAHYRFLPLGALMDERYWALLGAFCFLLGMVWFSLLAGAGFHRLRFANQVPEANRPPSQR